MTERTKAMDSLGVVHMICTQEQGSWLYM